MDLEIVFGCTTEAEFFPSIRTEKSTYSVRSNLIAVLALIWNMFGKIVP